ncbi:MAG: site-specific integrase [Acidobacteria bacterium]|nr:MAG: site-specific integrase [Acidobacteriota bacterium]
MAEGISRRHSKACPARDGGRCRCNAGWEAWVYSKREDKKIRKTFASKAEAKSWRADAVVAVSRGSLRTPKRTTVEQAWQTWKQGAEAGTIRNRSGDRFKSSAIRGYDQGMRLRVLPEFGDVRLADLDRVQLQRFVYGMLEDGLSPRTIDTTLGGLRGIFRYALDVGDVVVNPTKGIKLPRSDARRDRVADAVEGAALLAALPVDDRPYWAVAMYAGLRRGEIQALRACDVDLDAGVIRVEFGWDDKDGPIELKTRTGRRRVPIAEALRGHLLEQQLKTGRVGQQLAFGRSGSDPLRPGAYQGRADKAWEAAGLKRITPHECRHTYASLMIAAGINAKALSTFMGHANIKITFDLYGHLFPGGEGEAAELLDAYLDAQIERSAEAARVAGSGLTGAPTGAPLAHDPEKAHG